MYFILVLDDNGGELCSWRCHSALNYGSSPCGRVAFSQDGSLLAVIYDKVRLCCCLDLAYPSKFSTGFFNEIY